MKRSTVSVIAHTLIVMGVVILAIGLLLAAYALHPLCAVCLGGLEITAAGFSLIDDDAKTDKK